MSLPHHRPLLGVLFLVLAVACFATLDTSVKVLSATISVLLAVWFRYLFQAIVMAAVVLPTRGWRSLQTRHPVLHAVRGALLLTVSVLGFISLIYMPLGEFTAIIMLTPLVVTLMAALFLKEQVSVLRWLLVLGGFSGALLVIQPTGQAIGWAVVIPLVLVLFYAVFQILTSRMARTEDPMTMHFYTGWAGALVLATHRRCADDGLAVPGRVDGHCRSLPADPGVRARTRRHTGPLPVRASGIRRAGRLAGI